MLIRDDETIDYLDEKLIIFQKKNGFKFGIDAVLLADFAKVFPKDSICDLCTGGGILPLLLSCKNPKSIVGIELQKPYAEMAMRSVEANDLAGKIKILAGDLKDIEASMTKGSFDTVTVNPPYKEVGGGLESEATEKNMAKNEIAATLEDVTKAVAYLLKPQGKLFMVHRTERLADIVCTLRAYQLEIKRMRLIQGSREKSPALILLEAQKGAKPKMQVEPTLIVMENGVETPEIQKIYKRAQT